MAAAVLKGHISGRGSFTHAAEELLEATLQIPRALLTTSCTHALEMAALLCRLQPGDEVVVPSFTFVSTASAFVLAGARPVFVDSRQDTLNINESEIEAAITPRTKAICVVHYGGVACQMDDIMQIARDYKLMLIEDNAHGLYAKFKGKYLGTFGSLSTQSFHETKNITCGEGGSLHVNDAALIERAEILREKGTNRSSFSKGLVDKYTWVDIGSSWVLSDLLAALLLGQLQRVAKINDRRVQVWSRYHEALKDWANLHGVLLPIAPAGCEHVGHLYFLRFRNSDQRIRFIEFARMHGVSCVFHYQPLHVSPVGRRYGGHLGQCPVAEDAGECLVRLPLYTSLTSAEQEHVIEVVKKFNP